MNNTKKPLAILLSIMVLLLALAGWEMAQNKVDIDETDYSDMDNWALYAEGQGDADLFFLCPTVDLGTKGNYNMDLNNTEIKGYFLGASKMELGIYDDNAVVYAPYYRQKTFSYYTLDSEEASNCNEIAYEDVKDAFRYYLEKSDPDRPLILAGFSQGSEMLLQLMKDLFDDEELSERLVAAYAIGWRLTQADVEEYSWLHPAQGEDDTGVIVTFNSESDDVTDSLLVPEGSWTYSINPLNWKTDTTPATAAENEGACFTDYEGTIVTETAKLTGAYIDAERGTLICPDIVKEDYANDLFPDGVYHLYDYQFFYRNLEENVSTRLDAWMVEHAQ